MLLLLIGGFIIVSTGVTGLYIGKIFSQVKYRPLFIVEDETTGGFDDPSDSAEIEGTRPDRHE